MPYSSTWTMRMCDKSSVVDAGAKLFAGRPDEKGQQHISLRASLVAHDTQAHGPPGRMGSSGAPHMCTYKRSTCFFSGEQVSFIIKIEIKLESDF